MAHETKNTFGNYYHPPGTSPGTYVQRGSGQPTRLKLFEYHHEQFSEMDEPSLAVCASVLHNSMTDWLDVSEADDPKAIVELGETFGLHPLAMEDILNSGQHPKIECQNKNIFMILNLPARADDGEISFEQVSLFMGDGHLLSFSSGDGTAFEPVRARLRAGSGRIRKYGESYLLYALVDVVVDSAFPVLGRLGELIEDLEDKMLHAPDKDLLTQLHEYKREMVLMRRALGSQREVMAKLLSHNREWGDPELTPYFSDCYDHSVHVYGMIETYREMLNGLLDVYLSSSSHQINEVMRLLAIISTIFIPLTFIVGVYGMNFQYIPELAWKFGYFGVWGLMITLVVTLIIIFRRAKWL